MKLFIILINYILLIESVINVKRGKEETKVKCIKKDNRVYCPLNDENYPKWVA